MWVPAVIYLYAIGSALPATLVAIWCAGVVGSIDNFLRPVLVGKDAEMPDLLILSGTLGGLFLFGPIGFIVGPVVCGLFLTASESMGPRSKCPASARSLQIEPMVKPQAHLEKRRRPSQSAVLEGRVEKTTVIMPEFVGVSGSAPSQPTSCGKSREYRLVGV